MEDAKSFFRVKKLKFLAFADYVVCGLRQEDFPLLGVCILTFNSELTIKYVLKFLLTQDYPAGRVFYLIVDGGSSDGTLEVINNTLKNYPDLNFEVLVAEGTNIPQARNVCLENMVKIGVDYVLFVDSDTVVAAPNALKTITQLAVETKTLMHFPVTFRYFKGIEDLRTFINEIQPKEITVTLKDLIPSLHIGMGFTIIPKELASSQKFEEDLDIGEDFFYAFKALNKGYTPLIIRTPLNHIYDINLKGKHSDLYWKMPFRRYLKSMRKKTMVRLISWTKDGTLRLSYKKLTKEVIKHFLNTLLLTILFLLPVLVFVNIRLFIAALTVRLVSMLGYAIHKRLYGYGLLDGLKNRIKFELYSTLLILNLPVVYREFMRLLSTRRSVR